ncbi:hypothetical protein P7C71_g5954, partial [Lecanoromycetidae sp. Uapishka_2]
MFSKSRFRLLLPLVVIIHKNYHPYTDSIVDAKKWRAMDPPSSRLWSCFGKPQDFGSDLPANFKGTGEVVTYSAAAPNPAQKGRLKNTRCSQIRRSEEYAK